MQSGNGFRRAFSLALVLMLLVITGAPAFAASKSSPSGSYVVTASRLNVHSTPSLGNVTRKLKRGAVVTYVRSKNGWWYVKFSGGSGYVDKTYLKSMGSTTATYKTTCNLYVRYSASATSTAIGKLKKGTKVSVVRQKGSWSYISYKGRTGWVASKYLKKA